MKGCFFLLGHVHAKKAEGNKMERKEACQGKEGKYGRRDEGDWRMTWNKCVFGHRKTFVEYFFFLTFCIFLILFLQRKLHIHKGQENLELEYFFFKRSGVATFSWFVSPSTQCGPAKNTLLDGIIFFWQLKPYLTKWTNVLLEHLEHMWLWCRWAPYPLSLPYRWSFQFNILYMLFI